MARIIVILLLCLACLVCFFGCGSDPADPGGDPDPGPDWPEDALALPAQDEAALDSAASGYALQRQTLDAAAARTAMVTELNDNWPDIAAARLASDGTTIEIEFTDGAGAVIITDETLGAGTPPDKQGMVASKPWETGPNVIRADEIDIGVGRLARTFADKIACGDAETLPSRRVSIVNMAGGSDPSWSRWVCSSMVDTLLAHGWTTNDIDVSTRSAFIDTLFTPDTILQQAGYGLVFLIGHGGFRTDDAGLEHFIMQGWYGGSYSQYADVVEEARWNDYRQWHNVERIMLRGATYYTERDTTLIRSEVYIRDDCLAQHMVLDPGAMVSLVCCNSWELRDEFLSLGASSFSAWEGSVNSSDGAYTFCGLLEAMVGAEEAQTDEQAFQAILDLGLGHSEGHGVPSFFRMTGTGSDLYLSTWAEFTRGPDCLPVGTDHLEVELLYEDCPELDESFDLALVGAHACEHLVPVGADVKFKVKDGAMTTIAGGWHSLPLTGGENEVELCPCAATLTLTVDDTPAEGEYAATGVHCVIDWEDPTIESLGVDRAPAWPLVINELIPDRVSIEVAAVSAAGDTVARTAVDTDLDCEGDGNPNPCFGWLRLTASAYPLDTATIRVTTPDITTSLPAEALFAADGSEDMFGFVLGDTVTLEAEASNSSEILLGTQTLTAVVDCGATEVDFTFETYGLVLDADPRVMPSGTTYASTITATAHLWQEGDEIEPTGDPVSGKFVEFDTDFGSFEGPSSGTTGADGEISVILTSVDEGRATLQAFVADDLIEAEPLRYVCFGDDTLLYVIDGSPSPVTALNVPRVAWVNCVSLSYRENGSEWFYVDFDDGGLLGQLWCQHSNVEIGDTVGMRIEPIAGCPDEDEFSYTESIYVHWFCECDMENQTTVLVHSGGSGIPLTIPIEFEVILEDLPVPRNR